MVTNNDGDEKRFIKIHVPNIFSQLLLGEMAKIRGLDVNVNSRGKSRIDLFCRQEEADTLLRDARPAGNVLYLLQLEAVVKSLAVVGEKPTQEFINLIEEFRSRLGSLAARI